GLAALEARDADAAARVFPGEDLLRDGLRRDLSRLDERARRDVRIGAARDGAVAGPVRRRGARRAAILRAGPAARAGARPQLGAADGQPDLPAGRVRVGDVDPDPGVAGLLQDARARAAAVSLRAAGA